MWFLFLIFVLRPIIDLAWNFSVGGINLAGVIASILSFLLFLYLIFNKSKRLYNGKLILPFILYATIVTILYAKNISEFDSLFRLISPIIYFLVVARFINEKKLEKYFYGFIICSIIPIIIAYLQAAGIIEYTYWDYVLGGSIGRASGGYRQPSVLTRMLSISILYSLYFLSKYKNTLAINKKILLYLYVIVALGAMFFSYHRTGYLIILSSIVIWITIENKKSVIKLLMNISIILIVGVISIFVAIKLNLITIELSQFKAIFNLDSVFTVENGSVNFVLRGRSGIIDKVRMWFSNMELYYLLCGNGVNINYVHGYNLNVADMDFIRVLWNYGIVGLLFWGGQIIYFIKILLDGKKYYCDKYIIRIGMLILITYIVFGFTIESSFSPNLMYHVYLIMGYIWWNTYKKRRVECIEDRKV